MNEERKLCLVFVFGRDREKVDENKLSILNEGRQKV